MQIYLDNDKDTVTVVQSVASASTMISSLANEAVEYVKSKFPPRFFKHTFIDTSQMVTQKSYNEKYNKTANKIPYPSISVTPIMSLDDPIGGMDKSLHLSSPNLYLRRDMTRSANKLISDPDRQFSIYYSSDYITTNFDFKITLNTYIQNVNTAFYLKSRFQAGFFQYLNHRYIQSEIPKSLIAMMADLLGYDLDNSDDMDALRLYLIGTSKTENVIQKKINLGTGKQCFFINKEQNLLVLFTDLDCPPSVIKEGMAEGEYTINFRVQISAWIPNAFVLHINRDTLNLLSHDCICMLEDSDAENGITDGVYTSSIHNAAYLQSPADTIRFTDDAGNEQIGILAYSGTYTNKVNALNRTLYLLHDQQSKFKTELSKVIAYANENNIDLSSLIHISLISNNGPLHYNDVNQAVNDYYPNDYEVDLSSASVTILNDEYLQQDFFAMVYINRLTYDSIREAMEKGTFYFHSNFLAYIYGKTDENTPIKIAVSSFSNSKEKTSASNAYALRVNTAYGIGYIGLDDLDDSENSYRICIGFDSSGAPIMKQLNVMEV